MALYDKHEVRLTRRSADFQGTHFQHGVVSHDGFTDGAGKCVDEAQLRNPQRSPDTDTSTLSSPLTKSMIRSGAAWVESLMRP